MLCADLDDLRVFQCRVRKAKRKSSFHLIERRRAGWCAKNCGNPLGNLQLQAKPLDRHPDNAISSYHNCARYRVCTHCERDRSTWFSPVAEQRRSVDAVVNNCHLRIRLSIRQMCVMVNCGEKRPDFCRHCVFILGRIGPVLLRVGPGESCT